MFLVSFFSKLSIVLPARRWRAIMFLDVWLQSVCRTIIWFDFKALREEIFGSGPITRDVLLIAILELFGKGFIERLPHFSEVLILRVKLPGWHFSTLKLKSDVFLSQLWFLLFELEIYVSVFVLSFLQSFKVYINSEQSHLLDAALDCDCVDLSTYFLNLYRKAFMNLLWDEESHTKLLGSCFKSWSHIHIWGKVRSINFEVRTNGTFNSPTLMETEPHLDLIVR